MIVVDSQPHAAREKEILERVQEIGGYGNARCGYWQGEAVVGGEGNRGSERVRTDSSIRKHDASYGIPSPETNPVKSPLLLLCTSRRAARIRAARHEGKIFFSSGSRRSEDMEAQGVGIGERKRYWGERTTE